MPLLSSTTLLACFFFLSRVLLLGAGRFGKCFCSFNRVKLSSIGITWDKAEAQLKGIPLLEHNMVAKLKYCVAHMGGDNLSLVLKCSGVLEGFHACMHFNSTESCSPWWVVIARQFKMSAL